MIYYVLLREFGIYDWEYLVSFLSSLYSSISIYNLHFMSQYDYVLVNTSQINNIPWELPKV